MEFAFDDRSPMSEAYVNNVDVPAPPLTRLLLLHIPPPQDQVEGVL